MGGPTRLKLVNYGRAHPKKNKKIFNSRLQVEVYNLELFIKDR